MTDASFEVRADPGDAAGETLVVGFSMPGMAGISAVDYLVRQHDFAQVGHVRTRGQPAIAPFENGQPRHPVRLYADADLGVTVLLCELYVPVTLGEAFADGLVPWVSETALADVTVLHGIPYPHGPEGHDVYATATPDYRERRLADVDVTPLTGGFFDGAVADLVLRAMDGDGPPTGVFVTPSHPPGPDLDAALRLLDALERVTGVSIDRAELDRSAAELRQYYAELADRVQTLEEAEGTGTREYPEDRMFM